MKRKSYLCLSLILTLIITPVLVHAEVTEPTIVAESAILMDANTKTILYEKNAYTRQYPASITKLMTALLAIENLEPTNTITFSKEAIFGIERGSSHIGIDVDEQLTVDQALHGLLLMSANEVANGLAEAVAGSQDTFAILMTNRSKELGAQDTHFMNAHGLHDENHYTTAYDMALIASYLSDNEYFLDIMKDTTYEIPKTNKADETRHLYQQHKMLNAQRDASIFREDVIGGKTGYTDQARQTLVTIAKQGDTTLVAVVLKAEKDTIYSDTAQLLDYGFESFHSLPLHSPNETIKTLPLYSVKSGQPYQVGNCSVSVEKDLSVLVSNDISLQNVQTVLDFPEYVDINAKEGDVIGEITYYLNSKIVAKNNLVLKQVVYSPSPQSSLIPKIEQTPSYTIIYAIGLVILLILVFLLIFFIRKKQQAYSNRLKFKKLFK